jgi:hypothetical protein
MDPIYSERSGVVRRNFLQIAASGGGRAAVGSGALAAPSEDSRAAIVEAVVDASEKPADPEELRI